MAQTDQKGFVDQLLSPLVLIPLTLAASAAIVGWGFVPGHAKTLYMAAGGLCFLGFGIWLSLAILNWGGSEDPQTAKLRADLLASIDSACQPDQRVLSRDAERSASPALLEKP